MNKHRLSLIATAILIFSTTAATIEDPLSYLENRIQLLEEKIIPLEEKLERYNSIIHTTSVLKIMLFTSVVSLATVCAIKYIKEYNHQNKNFKKKSHIFAYAALDLSN